ncbi:unnamed protein product [Meloidogyne enterolobii]|uniref:Uncharacterized protein n=1 Tax=Meloidogyne enterolobii TaxID=390850 RepID=A0ACB0XUA2_MELEN
MLASFLYYFVDNFDYNLVSPFCVAGSNPSNIHFSLTFFLFHYFQFCAFL